jgi:hypothetical protein
MVVGNINQDFFDQNSELTILSEVKKIMKDFPREEASKIMWGVYLLEHPKSIYYRMDKDDRLKEIKEGYYDLDIVKHKSLIEQFSKLVLSKEERMLKDFQDTLEKIVKKVRESNYNSTKDLDFCLKATEKFPKMYEGLKKLENAMKEENSKTQLRGNATLGAREKRRTSR